MTTTHDSAPANDLIIVGEYQFDFVVPGTYLRPQVLVHKPKIDIVDLHAAYLQACAQLGIQPDWELTTQPDGMKVLEPGFWRVGMACNEGWDVDYDLTVHLLKNQTVNVYDDPVEVEAIAVRPSTPAQGLALIQRRYVKSDSVDSAPVVGCVVRIYEPVSLTKLAETLKLLGVPVEITDHAVNVDADILMTAEGEIDFDLPGDPDGGSLSLHPRNVMQQHLSRAFIEREAKLLVQKHLHETSMTTNNETQQEVQAVDTVSAPTLTDLRADLQGLHDVASDQLAAIERGEIANSDLAESMTEEAPAVPEFTPVAPIESKQPSASVAPLQSGSGAQPISGGTVAPIQTDNTDRKQAKISPLPATKKQDKKNRPLIDPVHFGGRNVDLTRLMQEGIAGRVPRQHPVRNVMAPVPPMNVPQNTRIPTLPRSQVAQNALKQFAKSAFIDPSQDGIDHINIGTGATELGRWLNFNSRTPFAVPPLGEFASIGALWVYLRCIPEERTEQMRTLSGTPAREKSRTVRAEDPVGLYDMIADATWVKINTYEERVQEMIDNKLPYLMYIVGTAGEIIQTPVARWYVDVIRAIATALKRSHHEKNPNIVPDFSFLARFEREERNHRERFRRDKEERRNRQNGQPGREASAHEQPRGQGQQPGRGPKQAKPPKQPRLTQPQQTRRDDASSSNQDDQQQAA